MTALLAVVVERKVPTRFEAAVLVLLCAGVSITVWEGLAGSATGIIFCHIGTVCASKCLVIMPDVPTLPCLNSWSVQVSNAAMMTLSGRMLSTRVDALRLTFYTAPVCCLVLLPFYHWREVRQPSLFYALLHGTVERV